MNDDGPDYRQAEEAEMLQWLEEQDAKRAQRPLNDDEAFRRRIEEMHPWLQQWAEGELTK